jgi:hypothetical protein
VDEFELRTDKQLPRRGYRSKDDRPGLAGARPEGRISICKADAIPLDDNIIKWIEKNAYI